MIIFSLFVLHVLPAAFCYDIELQGKVKLANQYLAALRQPPEFVNLLLRFLPEKLVGKGKLPKLLRSLETAANPYMRVRVSNETQETIAQMRNQITDSPKQTQKPKLQMSHFLNYLQDMGSRVIREISTEIIKDLNIKNNITSIIAITTNDYKNMLQNYYDYVKKTESDANRDSLFLDMVETSTRLLFEEEKKLLNDIVMQESQNDHKNFKKITNELVKRSYLYRRQVMNYLCEEYKVCKEYPVISDYGAEIISEILMLDDIRFVTVLEILSKIFKQNEKIIERFTENEDRRLIMEKLQDSTKDLFTTREYFAMVRAMITQRFKPITTGSTEFKTKIEATRILLDILDKALNVEDDVIIIDIENSLQAIRSWAAHERDDIEKILDEFLKNLIMRLEHNMTKNARKEVKYLITGLLRKQTEAFYHLMKVGSKYLKGKDFHPDIDIMLSDNDSE
ncbi:hypothetical protein PYW08_008528 [Mythimna loreyi]|uniref:Uncharacterized protein n=1 Tax=Mythimna loreyi TaxID=667449 RepID=A0ACC2Q8X2_9NEOP|nr:hypothetical protein PYW08_008528 [Mythimna loreyi]